MLVAKHRGKSEARPSTATPAVMQGPAEQRKPVVKPMSQAATAAAFEPDPAWIAYGLRLWLVAMFGWTLWVTRLLWTAHVEPPLLPVFDSPLTRFDYFGEALFAVFAAGVVWPRVGLASYVVVAGLAMTADQTRMQPQMFSFALLMLGTWPNPTAKLLARTHLSSLWFFSGMHKLFSPDYYTQVAPWLWQGILPAGDRPPLASYASTFGATLALIEVALGIAICFPQLRKIVAWIALGMHLGIVALLNHLDGWNTSVWGWNCAIAVVAFVIVGRWREPLQVDVSRSSRWIGAAAALLFASPVLFYFGSLDAYLCHCLYSANVASAEFQPGDGKPPYKLNWIGESVNVPLPPAHRLFEAYFRAIAKPGDRMLVRDPRRWAKSSLNDYYLWLCDPSGIHREQLATQGGEKAE
jgi:uncharacterized membrane protein YphA (DoxX/SURF4 family)